MVRKILEQMSDGSLLRLRCIRLSTIYDSVIITASYPLALRLLGDNFSTGLRSSGVTILLIFVLLSVTTFNFLHVQASLWRHIGTAEVLNLAKAITFAIVMFGLILQFAHVLFSSRPSVAESGFHLWTILAIQWLLLVILLCGARLGWATLTSLQLKRRTAVRYTEWQPVIIIGANEMAALLVQLLNRRSGSNLHAVGLLDAHPHLVGRTIDGVPVLGTIADLPQVVARLSVHGIVPRHVIFSVSANYYSAKVLEQLYYTADVLRLSVLDTGDLMRRLTGEGVDPGSVGEISSPTIRVERRTASAVKRATDFLGAILLIVASGPVLLLLLAVVWANLGSPVIFRQIRLGRGMRPFTVYKVRTLRDSFSPAGLPLCDQQRRTPLGNFIRRIRLDELPQLWNVVMGDMSLVGPRPLLAHEPPDLAGRMHPRFLLRPGITGWAQVNGGRRLSVTQKFALDLWYYRHRSFLLDARIVLKTIFVVLGGADADEICPQERRRSTLLFFRIRRGINFKNGIRRIHIDP